MNISNYNLYEVTLFFVLFYFIVSNIALFFLLLKVKLMNILPFGLILYNNSLLIITLSFIFELIILKYIIVFGLIFIHLYIFWQKIINKTRPDSSGLLFKISSFESKNQHLDKNIKVAFIIPVQNQSVELDQLLNNIPEKISGLKTAVVVVDNQSVDSSQFVAIKHKATFLSSGNLLDGRYSYDLGIEYLKYGKVEYIFLMDIKLNSKHMNWEILVNHLQVNTADMICGYYNAEKNGIRSLLKILTLKNYYSPYAFVCQRANTLYKRKNCEINYNFIVLVMELIKNKKNILQVYLGDNKEFLNIKIPINKILGIWINLESN